VLRTWAAERPSEEGTPVLSIVVEDQDRPGLELDLDALVRITTNRYAEINTQTKHEALRANEPPNTSGGCHTRPVWKSDESLMDWLASL
jgi:hypothetical protein